MICGIYKITNKVNGKIYIGQSVDIEGRWKGHMYNSGYEYKKIIYIAPSENTALIIFHSL